jgi:hypothetical protein
MSESQAAHFRARRMNRTGLSLLAPFRLSHDMFSKNIVAICLGPKSLLISALLSV